MKTVDFNELRAKKNGEITVKRLIENLLNAVEQGEIESVVYVTTNKNGEFLVGNNDMWPTDTIGMLEVGKQLIIDDMYTD